MEEKRWVIIVGGGPAGSFTALHLVSKFPELAEEIILLEAKHQGRDKICAGGVSGRVILGSEKDLGLDIGSLDGKTVDGVTLRLQEKESVTMHPGLGKVIHRSILDSYLLQCVKDRGVEVLTETPVRNVVSRDKDISVETEKGVFTGKVLVGADGIHGITKKALGVGDGKYKEYLWFVELPDVEIPPILTLDYTPTLFGIPGYIWFFPCEKGCNAGITGGTYNNMNYLKKVFLHLADKNFGVRLKEEDHKFKIYPERFFSFSTPSYANRVLYVGDKLGVTPMTGEGLGICFSSAKAAAEEIFVALGSDDFSFRSYPRRLVRSDFIPMWFMEQGLMKWKKPFLLSLFFYLATDLNRPPGKTLADDSCNIFSGKTEGQSLEGWGMLLKALPTRRLLSRWV